jgi:hypothetical protein
MRTTRRCVRLMTFLSLTMMLATPAIASDEKAAAGAAAAEDQFCIYQDGRTDTPETGPLPCDTSRRYMIGRIGFGSPRIPADSEFSTAGPKSHLEPAPSSHDAPGADEGTMASPATPDVERSPGIEAP